ncbi:helix-turn-helix domain-containing protein [Oleisolibacter albus]|uniref:helix-turn-helix domain-containing protein n=1 Tax=Oleisolibacter albus TaxID=2171757 RepID=UPI0012D79F95|nr:helix-turn-helix domain-containing protein [Oleisolibacter albus]
MVDQKRRQFDVIDGSAGTIGTAPGHAPDASQPTGIQHVGELLRFRRQQLGLNLTELAGRLRIRESYLQAIEQGRWTELPGQAYVTGFLRSYAQALDLDATQVLTRFKQDAAGVPQAAELYFPEPVTESRVPGGAVLLIAGLLGAVVYGGWYVMSSTNRSLSDFVPPLPDRLAALIYGNGSAPEPAPPPTAVLQPNQVQDLVGSSQPTAPEIGVAQPPSPALTGTGPAPGLPPAGAPPAPRPQPGALPGSVQPGAQPGVLAGAQPGAPTAAAPPAAEPDEAEVPQLPDLGQAPPPESEEEQAAAPEEIAPPPAPATPPTGRVFGVSQGEVRVVVRAVEDTWIEVRDAKGTTWAARNLRPGDVFRAPDAAGLTLLTGNAAGVVISLDGRDLPPLGARGQVVRNIALAPDALAARAAR